MIVTHYVNLQDALAAPAADIISTMEAYLKSVQSPNGLNSERKNASSIFRYKQIKL